jgi:hypothetical protein
MLREDDLDVAGSDFGQDLPGRSVRREQSGHDDSRVDHDPRRLGQLAFFARRSALAAFGSS